MQWIRITIFPIFTIITIISILIYFNMSSSEEQKNVLLCIAIGMLIMNILVFYLIGDILEGEEKLRKEVLQRNIHNSLREFAPDRLILNLMTTVKSQAVSLWAAVQATLRAFVCLLKVWTQKTLLTD